jgi:hypothetical protein
MVWPLITTMAAGLLLTVSIYLASHGTWDFFPSGAGFVRFYDFQGASLLEGHWDVPSEALAGEAFIRGDKRYGYFGFAPSLPRIILNYLVPTKFGKWSRISMIMGMVSLILSFVVLTAIVHLPPAWKPLLMVVLLGGSTAMFLSASELIYHEAILWGACLSIWAYICFARYLSAPRFGYLVLGAMFGFGAFFSRVSSGTGVMVCVLSLAVCLMVRAKRGGFDRIRQVLDWAAIPSPRFAAAHASFLLLFLIAMTAAYMRINYAKFADYVDPQPLRYNMQYDQVRIQRIHGSLVHPEYALVNAANYLDPRHIEIKNAFPYLGLTMRSEPSSFTMDQVEPYAAFPVAMPAMFALSIVAAVGLFRAFGGAYRQYLIILGSALVPGLALLTLAAISYRYQHDWYPFFFFGSILGTALVARMAPGRGQIVALSSLGIAGLWSIVATIGFIGDLKHSGLFGW